MKKQSPNVISASVMDQIKSGKVRMRPKAYYSALTLTALGAIILAGLSSAYLLSIIIFWIRVTTADTMAWGARANLNESIDSFPWWAVVASVILISIAVAIVRRHGRMYKHKTSSVALIFIALSLVLGLGLSVLGIGATHTPNQQNTRGPGQSQYWREQ